MQSQLRRAPWAGGGAAWPEWSGEDDCGEIAARIAPTHDRTGESVWRGPYESAKSNAHRSDVAGGARAGDAASAGAHRSVLQLLRQAFAAGRSSGGGGFGKIARPKVRRSFRRAETAYAFRAGDLWESRPV